MATSSISGTVFRDQNGDGSIEAGDPGLSGTTVSLLNNLGVVVSTTSTDVNGAYSFTGLTSAGYFVQVTAPTGNSFSPAGTSSTLPNSNVGATGRTSLITLSGNPVTAVDAGLYVPVSLSGTVFTDSNDNGQVDGTDAGLAGVTVQLLNAQGSPTGATATTASNGTYSFTNLVPGTYSVQVVKPTLPAGSVFSPVGSNTPPQPTGGSSLAQQNLLTNGSFDNGLTQTGNFTAAQGLAGWTVSANTGATPYGAGPGNGVEIDRTVTTGNTAIDPTGATNGYAGSVGPDNANPNYYGGSGYHAAFFVDDDAIETLSQTVTLTAGQVYEIGFDLNETQPGAGNPGYFQIQADVNGSVITSAGSLSGTKLTPGTWTHFADLYTPTTTGPVTLTFTYSSGVPGSTLASKDVLVDDVYIVPGQQTTNLTTTSEVNAAGQTAPVTLTSGETVGNESAGIYDPPATIKGTVFADANDNGVQDTGDLGVAGRTVNLYQNNVIIATTVTDSSGNYSFSNQPAGTYSVLVQAPSGDSFSPVGLSITNTDSTVNSSGVQAVAVLNGGTAVVNAGVYGPASVTGTVFLDGNADGVENGTDAGVGGQKISLVNTSGTVVATATTAANGTYSFTGLTPGSYTVKTTAPTGDSFSPVGTSTTQKDSTISAAGTQGVTVTSGGTAVVNAGEYAGSTISGTEFTDANADGTQNNGETGLSGQTVNLVNNSGTVIATTTTGSNGSYSFTNVAPGSDTVTFAAPAGDRFSTPSSDAVTVTSGSTTTENAGVYVPASVSGTIFTDVNADGVQESTDKGVAGQTVNLLNNTGTVVATTTTSVNGTYSFTGLTPATYTVQTPAPAGGSFSPVGTSTTLPDSGVSSAGTAAVTLTSGSTGTVNAGEYAGSTISGTEFTDANADGTQNNGETGLSGQTVNLVNNSGTVIATTTTGSNGSYSFTNVAPGSDTVQFTSPAGDRFSTPSSDAVTVISGSTTTENAGVYVPASVSGTIFTDVNADGVQESTDKGVAGQTVNLLNNTGTVVATTTTSVNGTYSFTGLTPATYTVQTPAPAGGSFSPVGTSTTLPDSGVSSAGTAAVTLTSGSTGTVNAGEYAGSTISGTEFTDANADGTQNNGETGLSGQTVNLVNNSGTVIATTTTGSNGSYSFSNVAPGSDTVQFTSPAGDRFSTPSSDAVTVISGSTTTENAGVYVPASVSGTIFTDVNADGVQESTDKGVAGQTVNLLNNTGTVVATTTTSVNGTYSFTGLTPATYTVQTPAPAGDSFSPVGTSTTLPDSGVSSAGTAAVTLTSGSTGTVNAGEYAGSTISGTEFTDANADGTHNNGETGLSGQTVNLVNNTGTVIATTTTGSNGSYSFTNVAPGSDTVTFAAPAGDRFSTPSSDAVTVTSGSTTTENAGVYVPASVSGTIFTDVNADGVQESTDKGVAGQTVNLLNNTGTVVATTTTSVNGTYSFTGLTPATYTVQTPAPAGGSFSPVGSSTTLPDSSVSFAGTAAVTLTSGSTGTVNAGEYAGSTISGTEFTDANADGTQNNGETGLSGQTVNLVNNSGTVIATTTTGSNGSYSFTNVAPGSDTVTFAAPAGDRFSTPSSDAVTVTSGSTTTENAGVYAPVAITGTVFTDNNDDGVQQAADAGLSGQTVQLLAANGSTVVATTTTSATGSYSFAGETPGTYTVKVVPPTGAVFSPAGTSTTLPDSNVSSGGTKTVMLGSGANATVNAGEHQPISITGTAFADANASGIRTAGDAPLVGLQVSLLDGTGHATGQTTTTDALGNYSFTGLMPGSYEVQVATPAGSTISPEYQGTDPTRASDVNAAGLSAPVTLTSGQSNFFNIGAWMPASLGGTVFNDANANGMKDTGETPVAGDTVTLLGSTGAAIATTTTDSHGNYAFAGLTPGTYTVAVTDPANSKFSPVGTAPAPAIDSVVDATGKTAPITLVSGEADTAASAGIYPAGTISSYVFLDGQADGTYHVGDPGVAGVTVRLLDGSGQPTGQTTITDATGHYSFAGLTAGSFEVQVVAPTGTSFSTIEHASGNALVDSDVNPTTGVSGVITVQAGATTLGANAGLIFNGNFAGTTPIVIGAGQTYDGNGGSGVIVGPGGDLVHTGSGGNNIVVLGGQGGNLVEAGGGSGTDIVTSASALNAQTQNASNGFLFAGGTGMSTLQGGQGNTYLQGGRGNDLITAGSGVNVLIGGGSTGTVQQTNGQVTGYTQGDELRTGGISTTVLYQKGDGVETIDNGFRVQDKLEISGYASGTMETVNGQQALYLGGNDLIIFNGGTNFGPNGISYDANPVATAQESVVFGANGLPSIVPVSSAVVTTAPVPVATPAAAIAPVSTPAATPAVATTTVVPVVTPATPVAATPTNNDPISISGWNQTLVVDNGNHVISGSQGNATLTVGNGNDTITMQGWGNVITTGSGTSSIVAGNGNETVNTGAGNDTVTLSGWNNLVIGGIGHDVVTGGASNTYQVNGAGTVGGMDVNDFSYASNDVLDLSKILASSGWNGSAASLGNILKVSTNPTGDTVIGIDTAGPGGAYATVATLHGLGAASVADLQNHGAIKLS